MNDLNVPKGEAACLAGTPHDMTIIRHLQLHGVTKKKLAREEAVQLSNWPRSGPVKAQALAPPLASLSTAGRRAGWRH